MGRVAHEIEIAWKAADGVPERLVGTIIADGIEHAVHMAMIEHPELELVIADSQMVEVRLIKAAAA